MSTYELPDERLDVLAVAIDEDDANNALWHHFPKAPGLREPGSFIQSLVDTITRADPRNQGRLAYGFPGLVAAVQMLQGSPQGVERLRAIAGAPIPEKPED